MPNPFNYRVNFLGCPSEPDVPWTRENLQKLVDYGFNTIQLNIAWGCRPGDEALNLEDVLDCTSLDMRQSLPLLSDVNPAAVLKRRENLRHRIALCREMGLRTIFHFGAPYNMHARYGDTSPNCLKDEAVVEMYRKMIELFDQQFPGVDDLLLYTYDQDAWLCSEFGDCPRCMGIPLHERVSDFVNTLARSWHGLHPDGRLWWEPWELSAGQVLMSVDRLDANCVALALHCTIAEVFATLPVDRWLKNTVAAARKNSIPVLVEYFMGGPTEEVEPYKHLSCPHEIWHGLKSIAALDIDGIKEYYGSIPSKQDDNLRMAAMFFENPDRNLDEVLRLLAKPYGDCGDEMLEFWKAASAAMTEFPWGASWFIRRIGFADPCHSMDAAFIRGQQAHTPSWESNRRAVFMSTENNHLDPWAYEDVQLRCQRSADEISRALEVSKSLPHRLPKELAFPLEMQIEELAALRKQAISYACHLRETNLCTIMRRNMSQGIKPPENIVKQLRSVLIEDMQNQQNDEPCLSAIELLDGNLEDFLNTYFLPGNDDRKSRGETSVTSM